MAGRLAERAAYGGAGGAGGERIDTAEGRWRLRVAEDSFLGDIQVVQDAVVHSSAVGVPPASYKYWESTHAGELPPDEHSAVQEAVLRKQCRP